MQAAAFLAAAAELPIGDLDAIIGTGGLVVLAPHADDESLGCGGLIAMACLAGRQVRIVVLSDGVGSHPSSPSYPPARLRALREQEASAAATALGLPPDCVHFLRLPDRFVPSRGSDADTVAETIAAIAAECAAGAIFTTWRHDPHADHVAAANLVTLAKHHLPTAHIYAYPIWGWALAPEVEVGGPPEGARIDIQAHLQAKGLAIAAHRSQTTRMIDDDPQGFCLDALTLRRFQRPFEIFIESGR